MNRWLLLPLVFCSGMALAPALAQESPDDLPEYEFTARRVLAFGDVHGAFEALVKLLQANALIDQQFNWIAGSTHLVSLGDLVDRGPRSRDVMDLLRNLQGQAQKAGGRVHVLLGNHEVMNLLGELKDVSPAEYAAFAPDLGLSDPPEIGSAVDAGPAIPGYKEHRSAFAPTGDYGAWLLQQPVMIKINSSLFVHGGLSPLLHGTDLATLNREAKSQLRSAMLAASEGRSSSQAAANAPLLGALGPLWYRGSAACHQVLEEPILSAGLQQFGAQRLVVGHTPTPTRTLLERMHQRVFAIDTGMLASVYRGKPYLLQLDDSGAKVLDAAGQAEPPDWWHPVLFTPPEREALLASEILAGASTSQRWQSASKKTIQRAVARWRLDRALELWFVPLVVVDESGKRFSEVVEGDWLTDRQRRAQNRAYPNHCIEGHQNFLITAFDALVGVTNRTADTLLWHRATGAARLEFVSASFGTSSKLATYSRTPDLPAAMAERLRRLDEARLTELLGDLLSSRQIKAILERRDRVLLWPTSEQAP